MTIRDVIATMALYDYLGLDAESVVDDIRHGYLTCNLGRDHHNYWWYTELMNY